MSLRISLKKIVDSDSQSQSSEGTVNRRKSVKRRYLVNSDEDEPGQSNEEPQTITIKKPQQQYSHSNNSFDGELDELTPEADDDVNEGETSEALEPVHETGYEKQRLKDSKSTMSKANTTLSKKTTRALRKDEDFVDDRFDEDSDVPFDNADDEDFVDEELPTRTKGKGRNKTKGTRNVVARSEVSIGKEETKGAVGLNETAGKKRPRTKSSKIERSEDTLIDVTGDARTASESGGMNSPSQLKEDAPPPPKKRKFPTIKKNKVAGSAGPSTPISAVPVKSVLQDAIKPSPASRTPAALIGNADLDLSNASIYAELFKNPGGAASRAGVNRRLKDEERRKELDRMRDEAKVKRSQEAKHTFDLQSQLDKIARFEEKLRNAQSSAVFPNLMAAKWRELWERERRRQREREKQGWHWQEAEDEEGEMTDAQVSSIRH